MWVRLVLWDLDGSAVSLEDLRRYLHDESVAAFEAVVGLRLKLWISDRERNRWGAIYLWESRPADDAPLPSRARDLIGSDPVVAEWFELEASAEGMFERADLGRLGKAFSPDG